MKLCEVGEARSRLDVAGSQYGALDEKNIAFCAKRALTMIRRVTDILLGFCSVFVVHRNDGSREWWKE